MQKSPLSTKAMIATLAAAIPAAPFAANAVPSPKAPPSVFASSTAVVKGATTYSKGHFLLKDAVRIGPTGAAVATSATKAKATKSNSTKKVSAPKVQTAPTSVWKSA